MAFQYEKIPGFRAGLINRPDPRDIKLTDPRGLSKAQNISLDIGGKIRTIGGLEDFTKVDGFTVLTQTAKICPGSGLFPYGSDHWGGTDTIVDLGPGSNAASDEQGEVDATTGWKITGDISPVISSDALSQVGSKAIKGAADITTFALSPSSAITTVIGQFYVVHCWIRKDVGDVTLRVGTAEFGNQIAYSSKVVANDTYEEFNLKFFATTTTTWVSIFALTNPNVVYVDDFYFSKTSPNDLGTNWLALLDAANSQVDLYNVNDDSFTAALLDLGTVSSYVATIDTINFPTTKTITDSTNQFLNQGIKTGDIRVISGCTSETANNIMFVVEHVSVGTIRARGNPFTVAADEDGTVTLTKYNPVAFHYVNEALRASPVNGGIALRPKHYTFADRTHFDGADSSERKFANWFLNDVGPVKPTDVSAGADAGDQDASALSAGEGWEVGITTTADDGEWTSGTYIIACSFIYDDGQESALYVPSTDEEFGTAIVDGDSLTITARGKNDYDERISGGRVYCRLDESDDPWSLLVDISIAKGARATLSGTYNAWAESATADVAYTVAFKSLKLNLDSYESLAGIDPTTTVEVFTDNNAFWNTSVIARNRCFIGSVRYTDAGGSLAHFRDRILYSTAGAYDTFPIDNFIDVVQGDAEDYVKLGAYGNDLLCFKQRTLYIIDISDPDPAGWQMKQDANKGKYPFRGIKHPGAYFETPHGPAWCNEFGVFLYNGSEIVPLLGDKIELSEHPLAYQRYYEFDGTNDVITKSDDADLDVGTGDYSLVAIVNTDVVDSANHFIYSKGQAANPSYSFYLTSGNIFRFTYSTSVPVTSSADSNSAPVANTWYHLVGTADRSEVGGTILYVNSVAQSTVGNGDAGDLDNAVEASIGRGTSTLFWDGGIAAIALYKGILSQSDVTALYGGAPFSSISNLTALWQPKGISDATWIDDSGNSLDGTVVGATAIYEDSWAKFFTDYSILGYQARTNQIIVMRDCTGRWSSGADYGDCWIIDLDTGASTTGRRVFTAKIPYSNFATSWDQDLIIAEQTSATSVTIKQWTDEPQSQAAGLIDIRTADIDFNNPAYAKIFDALVAYYKSSAAQTTPFSYAKDGDDRQTAWIRLTGNMDAEGFWEKLTLEPTAFECDTIRFKLDNYTAAGTMELNDLTLRYQTEEEDID